jgi:nucleoside-diphosphate-sugar epimerase
MAVNSHKTLSLQKGENIMRAMVIGGTGLLGYHAVNHLLANGHEATILSLPPKPESLFPDSVDVVIGDMNKMSDDELTDVMKGHDWIVFAAGTDPKPMPKGKIEPFVEMVNVTLTQRSFQAARAAGVSRGVVCGSYFAHFNRVWPHLKISERMPYVASRDRQTQAAFDLITDDFGVVVLELPYIWGTMPNRPAQWEGLIKMVLSPELTIHYAGGGTMMTSVKHIAEAILGGLERGVAGQCYQIGDENVTWAEMFDRISNAAGVAKKPVKKIYHAQLRAAARESEAQLEAAGLETGITPVAYVDIETANTFFDPEAARMALGLTAGGLDEAIKEQVVLVQKAGEEA